MINHEDIKIVTDSITIDELKGFLHPDFGTMVKAVVDLERKIIAVGGELHADEEAVLLEDGSQQQNLWGINLHLDQPMSEMIEFDSMINIRPSQGNRSRSVEDQATQLNIIEIVKSLIK